MSMFIPADQISSASLFTFSRYSFIIPHMNMLMNKKTYSLTKEQEREASRMFGRHVSSEKAAVLLCLTLITCASPMLLGLRLWDCIPVIVETGLSAADGSDDSIPRAVLVFGVPGLMCLLNLICHVQLWLHQKTERVPPVPIRFFGRWGIPAVSLLLCSFWIFKAGKAWEGLQSLLPCVFALFLLLLGSHFFDCSRDSRIAFHLKRIEHWETPWRKTHRFAGLCWMFAGLQLLFFYFGTGRLPWISFALLILLLLSEIPAAAYFSKYNNKQ